MQLLLILALLLAGGKAGSQNILNEVRPVLENLGGEELREALKSAEEITEALSAVRSLAPDGGRDEQPAAAAEEGGLPPLGFPLAPVSRIADRDITYSLSRYFSEEDT